MDLRLGATWVIAFLSLHTVSAGCPKLIYKLFGSCQIDGFVLFDNPHGISVHDRSSTIMLGRLLSIRGNAFTTERYERTRFAITHAKLLLGKFARFR